MAIPGQNFGDNIGFESEIHSYSVGIHEHCSDVDSNFYNIVPALLPALKIGVAKIVSCGI